MLQILLQAPFWNRNANDYSFRRRKSEMRLKITTFIILDLCLWSVRCETTMVSTPFGFNLPTLSKSFLPTSHNPSGQKNAEQLGQPIFVSPIWKSFKIGFTIHVSSCKVPFWNHLFCLFMTRSESWHKLHTLYCNSTIFQCSTSLIRCKRTRFSRTCKRWSASRREVLAFFLAQRLHLAMPGWERKWDSPLGKAGAIWSKHWKIAYTPEN